MLAGLVRVSREPRSRKVFGRRFGGDMKIFRAEHFFTHRFKEFRTGEHRTFFTGEPDDKGAADTLCGRIRFQRKGGKRPAAGINGFGRSQPDEYVGLVGSGEFGHEQVTHGRERCAGNLRAVGRNEKDIALDELHHAPAAPAVPLQSVGEREHHEELGQVKRAGQCVPPSQEVFELRFKLKPCHPVNNSGVLRQRRRELNGNAALFKCRSQFPAFVHPFGRLPFVAHGDHRFLNSARL